MLRIGIIGMSEGNGHPYSWSAIFNGYDSTKNCPFDVIPKYLNKQKFPNDFLSNLAKVTHIWTQDKKLSQSVANFAYIENIVEDPSKMINHVDAILLARDDAENHYDMAKDFIKNNIPVFIDKPLAYSVNEANKIYSIIDNSLIYSCSSIRFAKEFSEKIEQGFHYVNAVVMKSWERYAVHIIEPVISMFPNRGDLLEVKKINTRFGVKVRVVEWQNLCATFTTTHKINSPIKINIMNENSSRTLLFKDTFYAFRESLRTFVEIIEFKKLNIPKTETLEIIKIIEKGI